MDGLTELKGFTEVLALASGIAVIVGILTQVIKKSTGDKVSNNYMPIVSIVLGLIVGALVYPFTDMELTLRLWAGFMAGASASGLYDFVATLFKKKTEDPRFNL